MFGDSYKSWKLQFKEFVRMCKANENPVEPISAYKSNSRWIGWGGLRWCEEEDFQSQLNREGVQRDEVDNPKPRLYSKMKFDPMSLDLLTYLKP